MILGVQRDTVHVLLIMGASREESFAVFFLHSLICPRDSKASTYLPRCTADSHENSAPLNFWT